MISTLNRAHLKKNKTRTHTHKNSCKKYTLYIHMNSCKKHKVTKSVRALVFLLAFDIEVNSDVCFVIMVQQPLAEDPLL